MTGVRTVLLLGLLLVLAHPVAAQELLLDDFEGDFPGEWRVKEFSGSTDYRRVPASGGGFCLRATTDGGASGLILQRDYRVQDYPILSWRWKIAAPLPRGDARLRAGDDYAARIYVVFPGTFFFLSRSINYIWANKLPRGQTIPSPFTERSVMVALRSGADQAGEWQQERVDVLADYRRIFAEEPPPVSAIAIMTDADQTGGRAEGWYDDLKIGR